MRAVRGRAAGALLVGAALAVGVSAVWAQSSDDVITGCYKPGNGSLRIVESEMDCRDTVLRWNQQGPPGVASVQHKFSLGELDSENRKVQVVMCPEGEVATGGGFNLGKVTDLGPSVAVQQSLSVLGADGKTPVGWRVEAAEVVPTDEEWRLVATAVCARAG